MKGITMKEGTTLAAARMATVLEKTRRDAARALRSTAAGSRARRACKSAGSLAIIKPGTAIFFYAYRRI
jgi:hypothetical protein